MEDKSRCTLSDGYALIKNSGNYKIQVYNNLGQVIFHGDHNFIVGNNIFNLNLIEQPEGIFIVCISNLETSYSSKIIISK